MFIDTKEGQTNYCVHTEYGDICDSCLGKTSYEAVKEAAKNIKNE